MTIYMALSLFLLSLPAPARGHHVVFEQIGELAGALSHIHVKLTLNLSSIHLNLQQYNQSLHDLSARFKKMKPTQNFDKLDSDYEAKYYYQHNIRKMVQNFHRQHESLIKNYITDSARFFSRFGSLLASLPVKSARSDPTFHRFELRKKRFAPAVPLGILGTFMGLYSTYQVEVLKSELHGALEAHNRLVDVVQKQGDDMALINNTISQLMVHIEQMSASNPAYTVHELDRIERKLESQLDRAFNVLHALQLRRLSMELLESHHVVRLFQRLQDQSAAAGYRLLLTHHSDLFQLETSYFYDGSDIHLLVHVPMIPDDSLLRLFRLHSFPMPLSENHMMIPKVDQDVLAISSGFDRMSSQLSYVDLLGCHKVNQIYLCDQQSVLRNDLNSTCLGALYNQNFASASQLCQMTVYDSGEVVQQLLNNWYLAYSPVAQMAPVTCYNRTQSEIRLNSGITKFHLAPGCRSKLKQHILISDLTLRSETEILHYEWNWDNPISRDWVTSLTDHDIEKLQANGISNPTIHDIQHLKLHQTHHLIPNIASTVFLILFIIILSLTGFCLLRRYLPRFLHGPKPSAPETELKLLSPDSAVANPLIPATPILPAYHQSH